MGNTVNSCHQQGRDKQGCPSPLIQCPVLTWLHPAAAPAAAARAHVQWQFCSNTTAVVAVARCLQQGKIHKQGQTWMHCNSSAAAINPRAV